MPKSPTTGSYYALVYQGGERRQVTCVEATPQGFKYLQKLFKLVVTDTILGSMTEDGRITADLSETALGQIYLIPEAGELNSAPCISELQISRWAATVVKKHKRNKQPSLETPQS